MNKRTIEVSEETYLAIKDQLKEDEKQDINCYEDLIGKKFFFRTVTIYCVGRVEKIIGKFLELSTSSWIADAGRFMQAVKNGTFNEVEPTGTQYLNIEAVVDFFPANYKLPTEQK